MMVGALPVDKKRFFARKSGCVPPTKGGSAAGAKEWNAPLPSFTCMDALRGT